MLELTIDESDALIKVAHALSSKVRIDILKLLNAKKMNINEIAEQLNLPVSTIALNIRVLETAGIIYTELLPATRGTMKVCSRVFEDIHMDLRMDLGYGNKENMYQLEMPIGHYFDANISPTCGIITKNGVLDPLDEPVLFYHPERMNAQLIWFRKGYIDYRFPLQLPSNAKIQSVQFSMELCSEAPHYDHNWLSDITIWINDQEICTWTCPGDFGERKGNLNPVWFPTEGHTQYGLLKSWKITEDGSYLDEIQVSNTTLNDILVDKQKHLNFRIGIKSDAPNIGGINLFGNQLGDYPQDILMRVIYS
ncbi:helix-turn-helix domain-containing protein [Fictibacillus sp. WQ 8-8]|uniref:ArsR/SmtB family transcription factor n=1 Tax=Fictibacillus sp. WQ 8-8 TaxID=2938788 RepID=UPI002109163C|nr:helix-turn-helix domain-containing protein [Fictibacillus sp. WQ 8-8]MCQ6264691.1 helix-turn-helix domain-containing protein [Fictibacillus sp. WQ 8-8]